MNFCAKQKQILISQYVKISLTTCYENFMFKKISNSVLGNKFVSLSFI